MTHDDVLERLARANPVTDDAPPDAAQERASLAFSVRYPRTGSTFIDERGRRSRRYAPAHTNRYVYFVDAGTYLPVLVREDAKAVVADSTGPPLERSLTTERFTTFERLTDAAAERYLEPSRRFRKR